MSGASDPAALSRVLADLPGFLRGLARLFYIHDVSETSFQLVSQVPDFYSNAWPSFLTFILLENLLLFLQGRPTLRVNDSITSLSHGLIQECGRLLFRGSESAAYIFIYNHWRLTDLPWDSCWTWFLTLLAVDFCYYWVHRASHEVHLFWAQHQVHHSSEEFNIAVGLRQSLLQGWCSFVFYFPMALFVPPAHFLAHQQFNLLYQVWLHTKTVKSLGVLEYLLNTPQHHRVHHGCNRYCLDRNYGGVLIVWDRLFRTFAEERETEGIVYGLVHHQPSFNPLFLQVFYNRHVFDKWRSMRGLRNKLYAVVKGPSWVPGAPWTGRDEDKPDVKARQLYDVQIPFWQKCYVSIHFLVTLWLFQELPAACTATHPHAVAALVAYILFSLGTTGMILERHPRAASLETLRCIAVLVYSFRGGQLPGGAQLLFGTSAALWSLEYLRLPKRHTK